MVVQLPHHSGVTLRSSLARTLLDASRTLFPPSRHVRSSMQPTLSLPLEPHPTSPAIARDHARLFVGNGVDCEVVDDLALLVTELVTNAVRHGAARIRLEMTWRHDVLHVEVFDGSFDLPVLQRRHDTRDCGRGLQLVDAIASRWGARVRVDGKVVWCELAADGRLAPSP